MDTLLIIFLIYIVVCIIDILAYKYLYTNKVTESLQLFIFVPIIHIFTLPFILIDKVEDYIVDWINKDKI